MNSAEAAGKENVGKGFGCVSNSSFTHSRTHKQEKKKYKINPSFFEFSPAFIFYGRRYHHTVISAVVETEQQNPSSLFGLFPPPHSYLPLRVGVGAVPNLTKNFLPLPSY